MLVESTTVVIVDDTNESLFETSLPPQNEIKNIKIIPNIRRIIKLSQNVCNVCAKKYFLPRFLRNLVGATGFEPVTYLFRVNIAKIYKI